MNIMKYKITLGCFALSLLAYHVSYAETGISGSILLIGNDPGGLQAQRASIWYQPPSLIWKNTNIFFDFSAGHWHASGAPVNRSLNAYAIAPIIRYYFMHNTFLSPFFDFSIGASYLTKTRLDRRNLGMHFAFQDQAGLGATLGVQQKFSLSFSFIHYSNGSLCDHNSGFTAPLMLNISYGF